MVNFPSADWFSDLRTQLKAFVGGVCLRSKLFFLGPVHTSYFCRVEFNSIKCGRNATVDSYVALVSLLIQNLYCRVCRPAENVLNVVYSIWRTKVLSDEGL